MKRLIPTFSLFAAAALAQAPPSPPASAAGTSAVGVAAPAVDLAICLDISGSMNGLIHAARQNLWAVVNQLAAVKPTPKLRVALLTYGCNGHPPASGWVKVESGLTDDLDLISKLLFAQTTNGGEEYVARVVQTALEQLQWSAERATLKILFVCGNEGADQDKQVDFRATSKAAIARGVIVNSIYCGNPADALAPLWREVATLADGQFAAIDHNQNLAIQTPFDEQLVKLSAAINETYLPYGKDGRAAAMNQKEQDKNAEGLGAQAAAQRCQTKGGGLYWNAGWDLVDACADPKFELDKLKAEDLPESMRAMQPADRRAHVEQHRQRRAELRQQVEELGKKRDAFVLEEQKKRGEQAAKTFESAVLQLVRAQAERAGLVLR